MPDGTLTTFLFTDIAGSTRGWEEHGAEYGAAARRHVEIIEQAVAEHGGTVFKTVGDAVCAAFPDAAQGVRAAITAQRALAAEGWPAEIGPIRSRMALHAGTPVERDGDYHGPPVNRTARLTDAAHPEQILLSAAVHALLPPGIEAIPLGMHRLKDLQAPEALFQVRAPGLRADFPPPRTLDARPHNLPAYLTSFVGRQEEIRRLADRLAEPGVRMVTLTGPPGVGKTRLATQFAAEYAFRYPDGVWLVELGPVRDPAAVPHRIEEALGFTREDGRNAMDRLLDSLAERRLLLVCDNFEHLLPAADAISGLLRASSNVQVLVTSRSVLRVAGERVMEVDPLEAPGVEDVTPADLSESPATSLLLDRAAAARPGWVPGDADAGEVAELCRALDGLPLAIELAAARMRSMTVREIRARLSDRFRLLASGTSDLPERQRTLRAALDWSYGILSPAEQRTLAELGVFRGGFTLEAAEAVCTAGDAWELVPALHGHSFLVARERDGAMRYDMLEAVREYALARLGEAEGAARRAHAAHFLGAAERAAAALDTAGDAEACLALDADAENIREALTSACAQGDARTCARLTVAVAEFFNRRGWWTERLQRTEAALGLARAAMPDAPEVGWLFYHHANALADLGRLGAAREAAVEAQRRARERADAKLETWCLNLLGYLAERTGDAETAGRLYGETIETARRHADAFGEALALTNRGRLHDAAGRTAEAVADLERSLPLWEAVGSARGTATTLTNLGCILDEVLGAEAEGRGDAAAAHGRRREAIALFRQALAHQIRLDNRPKIALLLNNIGEAVERDGHPGEAVALFDAAEAIFRRVGSARAEYVSAQRARAMDAVGGAPVRRLGAADPVAFARTVSLGTEPA